MQMIPQNETGYAIGWTVVHSLWQGLALAITAGCILVAFKYRSPIFKSMVLLLSGAAMPIISLITFFVVYPKKYVDPTLIKGTALEGMPIPPALGETFTNLSGEVVSNLSVSNLVLYVNNHLYLILTVWLIGLGISLLRLLSGISYVHYLKTNFTASLDPYWHDMLDDVKSKLGLTNKNIDIVESALVRTPMIIGHLKPMILIPLGVINHLSDKQVEAILAHEVSHIIRKDYLINILQNIIESLYYFHPAMWWISSQLRNEREKCCDDLAIKACGDKIAYVKALVTMQELALTQRSYTLAFAGNSKNSLMDRVNRLIQPKAEILTIQEKVYASGVLLALLLTFQLPGFWPKKEDLQTAHCVSYFLKYDRDNQLDSLGLNFAVVDGVYRREDELQNVILEIEKNKVVKFTINGLNIAGRDMEKFQKLIESIVRKDDGQNEAEVSSIVPKTLNIEGNKTIIVDQFNNQHVLTSTEVGDNHLKITSEQGVITKYEFKTGGFVHENGKLCAIEKLRERGWDVNDIGFVPIGNFDIHGAWSKSTQQPSSASKSISSFSYSVSTNDEDNEETIIDNDASEMMADEEKMEADQEQKGHDLSEVFDQWAKAYLIKENIIKKGENFQYMMTQDKLIVNGKTMPSETLTLWKKRYHDVTGITITNSTYRTANFTY